MKIPDNMTEAEVLGIIDKITSKLAYKFTFGAYAYDDIKQEATIIALDGLESYKPNLPLENFLWVHVKNRLCNFKRDKFIRLDKPCSTCPLKAWVKRGDLCKIYDDKMDCELYAGWKNRNEAKKNVISPVSMSVLVHEDNNMQCQTHFAEALDNKELITMIDKKIPVYMRALWLQAKAGIKLQSEEMKQLRAEVLSIMTPKDEDNE